MRGHDELALSGNCRYVCYHLACKKFLKVGRNYKVKIEATGGRLSFEMRTYQALHYINIVKLREVRV